MIFDIERTGHLAQLSLIGACTSDPQTGIGALFKNIGHSRKDALVASLAPGSILIVGMSARRFFNKDRRLAKELERAGYQVIGVV